MVKNRDNIYQVSQDKIEKFCFDTKVAAVFEDMISRSVPGYTQILNLIPVLVKEFYIKNGNYYDLGCSLGAGMHAIANGLKQIDPNTCRSIIGIDSSNAMLDQAKQLLNKNEQHLFEFKCEDISNTNIRDAVLVLMNFTLQFIPLEKRNDLLKNIYENLLDDGVLIISEKINFTNPKVQNALTRIHHQFKFNQGYSELEISQKRDAIEDVLIPETLDIHINRLRNAGFKVVTPWVQNLQFLSILAIK